MEIRTLKRNIYVSALSILIFAFVGWVYKTDYDYNHYSKTEKANIPANFILGKMIFFNARTFCRLTVYEVTEFNYNSSNAFYRGYVPFQIGTKMDTELTDIVGLQDRINTHLGWGELCTMSKTIYNEYGNLWNNDDIVYTFNDKITNYLFYNPKTKHLFHFIAQGY